METKPQAKLTAEEQFRKMGIYTDKETEVIRSTFKTKEFTMMLRKFLWQEPMSENDRDLVLKNISKPMVDILRKTFIPTLSSMDSLEEMKDVWLFDFENMTPQYSVMLFKVRKLVGQYFNQMFAELEGNIPLNKIDFAELSDFEGKLDEDAHIDMSARNMIARETQRYLCLLYLLATPMETEEQKQKRLQKQSSK